MKNKHYVLILGVLSMLSTPLFADETAEAKEEVVAVEVSEALEAESCDENAEGCVAEEESSNEACAENPDPNECADIEDVEQELAEGEESETDAEMTSEESDEVVADETDTSESEMESGEESNTEAAK